MPQNGVFSLGIAHIAPSLFFCTKGIFFRWSQRDSMHLGPLCMQLIAPIGFSLLKCFFLVGCFCAGAVAPKPALFGGTHPTHLKTVFSTLITKLQTFNTRNLFSDTPRDLHYYWVSAQPCAALRSLAQLTTPFLASGKAPKWVFFPPYL